MLYLNEKNINELEKDWNNMISVIEQTTECLRTSDYAQPIKPYLRFKNMLNRIIAMPAFVGGRTQKAGIKWIASFPENIGSGIPRAHSVLILNNGETGIPEAIINTGLLSVIRTAAVSGSIIRAFDKARGLNNISIGIIGWGPIGKGHFDMVTNLLGDKITKIYLYDLKPINPDSIPRLHRDKVIITDCWQDAYKHADIMITCTVSKEPYIDGKPREGSLQLNVSLRDYKTDIYEYVKNNIIVDDWDEVCRENTDIEMLSIKKGLKKEQVKTIIDVICNDYFMNCSKTEPVMFNPMGMAVFDIAMGHYYLEKALNQKVGQILE